MTVKQFSLFLNGMQHIRRLCVSNRWSQSDDMHDFALQLLARRELEYLEFDDELAHHLGDSLLSTGDEIVTIAWPEMKSLSLCVTASSGGAEFLSRLSKLERLVLQLCQDRHVHEGLRLISGCAMLTELHIKLPQSIHQRYIPELLEVARGCPKLRDFKVQCYENIGDSMNVVDFHDLTQNWPLLEHLHLDIGINPSLTTADITQLFARCPRLESLYLTAAIQLYGFFSVAPTECFSKSLRRVLLDCMNLAECFPANIASFDPYAISAKLMEKFKHCLPNLMVFDIKTHDQLPFSTRRAAEAWRDSFLTNLRQHMPSSQTMERFSTESVLHRLDMELLGRCGKSYQDSFSEDILTR